MDGHNSEDKLTLSIIEDLTGKGLNQTEIADMYGVTRQYVSWVKKTYGGKQTPREIALKNFPWILTTQQGQMAPARNLRNHAEFMATGGRGMTADKLTKLRNFYKKLREQNVVVEFDPSLPPEPGVSSVGGFAYRPREASDGDLLIRVNEHTQMNEEGKIIWRFPPREP
ncbi:hypothetical protein [Nocardia terpenica]|uniref:Repressor n=1 Tax=Nocardia terpenica TaxID=455432 RepID=A0A164HVN2_9NOCA|nr:hypothetical protein [Nocardia terpenica]KZM68859.1 repressor [Nocardia terpenica]NQE88097.1 XRE family transcriptional regulator [Nocardia terpenica]